MTRMKRTPQHIKRYEIDSGLLLLFIVIVLWLIFR